MPTFNLEVPLDPLGLAIFQMSFQTLVFNPIENVSEVKDVKTKIGNSLAHRMGWLVAVISV